MAVAVVQEEPMADGFLGRWSQRKRDVREGKPLQEPAPAPVLLEPAAAPGSGPQAVNAQAAPVPATSAPAPAAAEPPPPTLADAQALTADSDFKPFVARGVAPEVRNAAMKKLFADPHYNVMDGLDIYIGDYSIPDPLPASMLRQMASAQFLGFFDDEKKTQESAPVAQVPAMAPGDGQTGDDADASVSEGVAQSGDCTELPSTPVTAMRSHPGEPALPASQEPHDHADLRLQPDDAPQRESAGRGTA